METGLAVIRLSECGGEIDSATSSTWSTTPRTKNYTAKTGLNRDFFGKTPGRFLVGRLEIVDVQHLAGADRFGKTREGLFLGQAHVLGLGGLPPRSVVRRANERGAAGTRGPALRRGFRDRPIQPNSLLARLVTRFSAVQAADGPGSWRLRHIDRRRRGPGRSSRERPIRCCPRGFAQAHGSHPADHGMANPAIDVLNALPGRFLEQAPVLPSLPGVAPSGCPNGTVGLRWYPQ